MKINVDGGLSRNGARGAAAAICRDKRGQFVGASVVVFDGLVDPATLEAQACNEAMSLAIDLHLDSVCVASDCVEVVANIETGAPC
jgi:ribonuclease HI